MRIRIRAEEAIQILEKIPHKKFREAVNQHWTVSKDGIVADHSILWLFCWCKNGLNSKAAREEAVNAWNTIMPVPFRIYEPEIDHDGARKYRYSKSVRIIP